MYVDKVKEGDFQRKPMTFCELTNSKHFEGFRKSIVENHESKKWGGSTHYGKFHKKNVFFIETFPKQSMYYFVKCLGTIFSLKKLNMYYLTPLSHILFRQRGSVAPLVMS